MSVLAGCGDDGPAAGGAAGAEVAVVAVAARPCDRPMRDLGVGVVVGDGVVATAAHVVDGPRREVTVDGAPAQVLAVDARTDVALLAADVDGAAAATLTAAVEGPALVRTPDGGHAVEVISTGVLIVHDRSAGVRHERSVHTFRPGVPEGTSGAPLVDGRGRVAGIVVLDDPTDGTAHAVTATEVLAVLAADTPGAGVPCPE